MRRVVAASIALLFAAALAGCSTPADGPTPAPSVSRPPTSSPQPSSSPSSSAPPTGGTAAAEAKAQFDAALATLLTQNADPSGRAVIDALADAGFDKASMEVTPDTTAIGLDADNIQFSVLVGDECVVGQSGNVGFHSAVLPVLDTGRCLVGKTRTIDW